MRLKTTIFRFLLYLVTGFLMISAFPLALWLLFHFETLQGLLLALLGIIGPLWGFWLYYFRHKFRHKANFGRINICWSGSIGFVILLLLFLTPSGKGTTNSTMHHLYSNGGRFVRFSPFNIIPEIEQMNVGVNLFGPLDPFIDTQKADRLANLTLEIYRELEEDADFEQIGSVMGLTMREVFQIPFDNGHTYLYVPQNASADHPVPAIIFLHGAGGPLKAYQWIWRDFAEASGFVIISPSYGFGLWPEQEGGEAIIRSIDYVADYLEQEVGLQLNQEFIWLAGLSNGGKGAIYTATQHPDRFQGLILISPSMPSQIMSNSNGPFNLAWRNRPVLLIHGEQDLRMPMGYLNQHIGFMNAGGIDLETVLYPEEDHFLFFAQRKELMQTIADWIAEKSKP